MGVKAQFLYFPHKRAYNLDKDTEIWLERPLQTHLELNAVYDVMYLLDLHRLTKVTYYGYWQQLVKTVFELNRTFWQDLFCNFVIFFTVGNFIGNLFYAFELK